MKKRLFVGIPLPDAFLNACDELKEKIRDSYELRWTPHENLHITVLFLGDVREELIGELNAKLRKVCQEQQPFILQWSHFCSAPPKKDPPSMIWCSFYESSAWYDFVEKVKIAFSPFIQQAKDQRRQLPHVTLARTRRKQGSSMKNARFEDFLVKDPELSVEECQLYESILGPDGSQYTIIKSFSFGK